ncbi:alpha/beta fold hydrolase [Halorhabdus sp. CUG00001]|uniref:alpha/beta fold hydrolase n=1 Tax=Halorhabdus sp. CUG00001 TaxID=2600297 RepID=UPI00131DEF83|nr:alpha/beta hydrolase [Halorhabdus sp. CUG00001]
MPTVRNGEVSLRYATAGEGPTVVFVNDVGLGAWYWSYLQPAIAGPYETVVWDLRGTGDSDTPDGPYAMTTLVEDLATVVAALEARRIHVVGAGLGGAIALEYARGNDNVASLALLGVAEGAAVDADRLASLAAPLDDPDALRESLSAGFTRSVPAEYPDEIERMANWRATDDADPDGHAAQRAAWREADLPDRYEVTTPTLLVSGAADRIVDPAATARLAADLPRGEHTRIEGGHLFPVSESQVVGDELRAWLDEQTESRLE